MADNGNPVLRDEFVSFQQEVRSDMREVRDGMVRADVRADQTDKRMGAFETQLADGFRAIRADIQSLKSVRVWVIGGVAAGGSAMGAVIFHSVSALFTQ